MDASSGNAYGGGACALAVVCVRMHQLHVCVCVCVGPSNPLWWTMAEVKQSHPDGTFTRVWVVQDHFKPTSVPYECRGCKEFTSENVKEGLCFSCARLAAVGVQPYRPFKPTPQREFYCDGCMDVTSYDRLAKLCQACSQLVRAGGVPRLVNIRPPR